jgi:anti-sigma-K factor RskA
MTCPASAAGLGAYVLGALDPDERRQVERHVADCPVCAVELAELSHLPALLDRVRPEDLQAQLVAPSPDLFARMSAAAGAGRRPASRTWALVAAAVLVLGGIGAGVAVWVSSRAEPAVTAEQTVTATEGPVEVRITASPRGDGVALRVMVAGMRPGETCRLLAFDDDGASHPAGDWPVSEAGGGEWVGWADVDPAALAAVSVVGDGGREVARLPF